MTFQETPESKKGKKKTLVEYFVMKQIDFDHVCMCVSLSVVSYSLRFDPMDYIACQALLSMQFSRQEYWSELPLPSPGDLSDPRIEPATPTLQADSLPSESPWKPTSIINGTKMYVCVWIDQSCLTLCDPMDCSPPGCSVHGILWARILECVAISFLNQNV